MKRSGFDDPSETLTIALRPELRPVRVTRYIESDLVVAYDADGRAVWVEYRPRPRDRPASFPA